MGIRSPQIPRSVVLAAAAVLGACAPNGAVLRSNHHYRLVVPTDWQVTEEGGVAVLHIPQATSAPDGGGRLQLHLHTWVVDRGVNQPVEESLNRLAKQGTAQLQPDGDAAATACGELPHDFQLFGQAQPAAHMRTPSGDYVVVTAAETYGSLVAAVGIVPNRAPLCDNLYAMTAAIQSLRDTLTPAANPTAPRRTPLRVDSPFPGRARDPGAGSAALTRALRIAGQRQLRAGGRRRRATCLARGQGRGRGRGGCRPRTR